MDKLDPRAELCVFVGIDPNGLGYRLARLPGFKITTSLHVTFVEEHYPCKLQRVKELEPFLTAKQAAGLDATADLIGPDDGPELTVSRGRGRPRTRNPSSQALLNMPDVSEPPSDSEQATTMYIDGEPITEAMLNDAHFNKIDVAYNTTDAPKTVQEAISGPDSAAWKEALVKEAKAHVANKTLGKHIEAKDLPPGVKPIPLDVILKVKRCGRKKARAIIKGYKMTEGIDYNEIFAPVPCAATLRIMLAIATALRYNTDQGDVGTAFLAADMDTFIVVAVPNWFIPVFKADGTFEFDFTRTGYSLRILAKTIPGVPQGPRLWHRKASGIFKAAGLTQSKADYSVYYNLEHKMIVVVWVDDIFRAYPTESSDFADKQWKQLQEHMDLADAAPIDDCLGCNVKRDKQNRITFMSQRKSIMTLLEKLNMADCKPADTPMVANSKPTKRDCPGAETAAVMIDEQRWYRSTIASMS